MPEGARSIFIATFNAALKQYNGDEGRANATAYSAVKKQYHQDEKGDWVKNKSMLDNTYLEISGYITKATVSPDGKMIFAATCSDTEPDLYAEKMSSELFKSFIQKFDGTEFVSLAHYPRLKSGKGEVGSVSTVYIDGNQLKAKGYFNDTPLGIAVFNSIRKDRRDNIPVEKRVRISIGFYDLQHQHGENGYVWNYSEGKPCDLCAKGLTQGKIYLSGDLDHIAVTRVPVNRRTEIVTRSEDMPTRLEDAASIVPEELAKDVEQEFRSEVNKSDETGLVTKSYTEFAQTLLTMKPVELQTLLMHFKENGIKTVEVDVDDLSNRISTMLNAVTTSEATVDKAQMKNKDDDAAMEDEEAMAKQHEKDMKDKKKKQKSEVEKMDDMIAEMQAPLGGALSLGDAKTFMDGKQVTDGMYKAFSIFGAVANNILNSNGETTDKLNKLQNVLAEFRGMLTPDKLKVLSDAETEEQETPVSDVVGQSTVKSLSEKVEILEKTLNELTNRAASDVAQTVDVVSDIKPEIQVAIPDVAQIAINNMQTALIEAVKLSGTDRKVALQAILNKTAADLVDVDKSLEPVVETAPEGVGVPANSEIAELKNMLGQALSKLDQVNDLSNRVTELQKVVQSQVVGKSQTGKTVVPAPVGKAVSSIPANSIQPSVPSKGLSVQELAHRSTFMPDGRPRI